MISNHAERERPRASTNGSSGYGSVCETERNGITQGSIPQRFQVEIMNKTDPRMMGRLFCSSKFSYNLGENYWRGGLRAEELILKGEKRYVRTEDEHEYLIQDDFLCRRMHVGRLRLMEVSQDAEEEHFNWLKNLKIQCSILTTQDVRESFALRAAELLKPFTFDMRKNYKGRTLVSPSIMRTPCFRDIRNIFIRSDNYLDLDFSMEREQSAFLVSEAELVPEELKNLITKSAIGQLEYNALRLNYTKTPSLMKIMIDWIQDGEKSLQFVWNFACHSASILKDIDREELVAKASENYFFMAAEQRIVAIRINGSTCVLKLFPSVEAMLDEIRNPDGF